jgi:chemotaxis protein histidine kinase CheA
MVRRQAQERLEALQKARKNAQEKKAKKEEEERWMEKEKEKKENGAKIRIQVKKQEKRFKGAQLQMDHIKEKALKARESANKAKSVHKEAKLKRRQFKEAASAAEGKGKESYSKAAYAKLEASRADEESVAARNRYHNASLYAEDAYQEADWSNHVKAKEQAAATGRVTSGWLQLKDVGDELEPSDAEYKSNFKKQKVKKHKHHEDAAAEMSLLQEVVPESDGDVLDVEEEELYQQPKTIWTTGIVPFADNFANAIAAEGLKPPPMADEVNILGAEQGTAGADSAQLGIAPPPPEQYLRAPMAGHFAIAPHYQTPKSAPQTQPKKDGGLGGGWIFFIILLFLICILIIICVYCRNDPRFKRHDQYAQPGDYRQDYGGTHPLYGIGQTGPGGFSPNYVLNSSFPGETVARSGYPRDPRRAEQLAIVMREIQSTNSELDKAPFHKKSAIQTRLHELYKWKVKLEDESRPLYATAHDRSSGFPVRDSIAQQRQISNAAFANHAGQMYPEAFTQYSPNVQQFASTQPYPHPDQRYNDRRLCQDDFEPRMTGYGGTQYPPQQPQYGSQNAGVYQSPNISSVPQNRPVSPGQPPLGQQQLPVQQQRPGTAAASNLPGFGQQPTQQHVHGPVLQSPTNRVTNLGSPS